MNGRGTFQDLATAFRKCLDEIQHVRSLLQAKRTTHNPAVPRRNRIDGRPLDAVLSMRGTVVGGTYRAAISKRALLHGEIIGREMGIATWCSFAGTNERAVAHGEFVETRDSLQKVLKALTAKGINIESIRNHGLGEEPQFLFVRFWGQGAALDLARAIRYALDIEVGAISLPETRR